MVPDQEIVTLHMPRVMVGQIIDGLRTRAESWEVTSDYMRGKAVDEMVIIEECCDSHEAAAIACSYRSIIDTIKGQLRA